MQKFTKFTFYAYSLVLVWAILFKFIPIQHMLATTRSVNLIPFALSGGWFEILINILLFIPFASMLALVYKERYFLFKFSLVVAVSLTFEILQYLFAIGASDITDIITNSLGGLIGLLAYQMLQKRIESTKKLDFFISFFALSILFAILALMIRVSILRF